MRNIITIATVFSLTIALATVSQAAPIVTVTEGTSTGGNDLYTFNIDPNGTVLDTIDITLTATTGAFMGENVVAVTEFVTGADNTDVLGINTTAIGWSILMTQDSTTTLAGAGGPLGQNITAPVDFAQAVFPAGSGNLGHYVFNFADDGSLVGSIEGDFGVPEPSTMLMASMGLLGLAFRRRR